jgi:hypothetical protein
MTQEEACGRPLAGPEFCVFWRTYVPRRLRRAAVCASCGREKLSRKRASHKHRHCGWQLRAVLSKRFKISVACGRKAKAISAFTGRRHVNTNDSALQMILTERRQVSCGGGSRYSDLWKVKATFEPGHLFEKNSESKEQRSSRLEYLSSVTTKLSYSQADDRIQHTKKSDREECCSLTKEQLLPCSAPGFRRPRTSC